MAIDLMAIDADLRKRHPATYCGWTETVDGDYRFTFKSEDGLKHALATVPHTFIRKRDAQLVVDAITNAADDAVSRLKPQGGE